MYILGRIIIHLQAFISCSLGVEKVGFVMICFGLSCSVSSLLFGKIARMAGYHVPFIIGNTACILNIRTERHGQTV